MASSFRKIIFLLPQDHCEAVSVFAFVVLGTPGESGNPKVATPDPALPKHICMSAVATVKFNNFISPSECPHKSQNCHTSFSSY